MHCIQLTNQSFKGPHCDVRKGDIVECGLGEDYPFTMADGVRLVESGNARWCGSDGADAEPPPEQELEEEHTANQLRIAKIKDAENLKAEELAHAVHVKAIEEKIAFFEEKKAQSPETFGAQNEAALAGARAELDALVNPPAPAEPVKAKGDDDDDKPKTSATKKTTASKPTKPKSTATK